jgi:hypothetical protein
MIHESKGVIVGTQTNFQGSRGAISWDRLLDGLGRGEFWAYASVIVLAIMAGVAIWAGTNMSKKGDRR